VIWYQGESNANQVDAARLYGKQLPLLIKSWREAWNEPELPFYFVQIANFYPAQTEHRESGGWPILRDMQLQTWKTVPHTGMAAAIDLGEADNIHPKNKQDVGRRLARHALKNEYGKDTPVSGPILRTARRDGDKVTLDFDHADGGLEARGGDPKGFALGDANGKWHWADAEIAGDAISLRSDKVPLPTTVAYGWATNPIGNLCSKSTGLPLTPFSQKIP
jgi:sialate O-acetylesterase